MSREIVSGIVLALLLASSPFFYLASNVEAASAGSKIITVSDDYPTIQQAVSTANPGDTIFVKNGTYSEHIVIGKPLTIIGENRDATVIDGGGMEPSSIVTVDANNVRISGFTIQHSSTSGGAVWVDSYVNSTISDNIIANNRDGIRIFHSSGNVVSDNIVKNNSYTGIGFDWAENSTIYNNTVIGNFIGIGAGNPSHDNVFSENTIADNIYGFLVAIRDSKFFHNNFVGNSVYAITGSGNTWDDGYPSGGNYWSDYSGTDLFSGAFQNFTGRDGLGDTPYIISENDHDNYPLMKPYTISHYDLNADGKINIIDVTIVAKDFGSEAGDPKWNPTADLNKDGVISIVDITLVAKDYGKTV